MSKSRIVRLFEEDQKDRSRCDFFDNLERVALHDSRRRRELRAILRTNKNLSAAECYAAAMIFQHGDKQSHFKNAIRYAKKAFLMGHRDAGRLYAATIDRLLMEQGLPQKYGTQYYRKSIAQKWRLWKVDTTTTDAMRMAYGVQSLRELKKELEELNSKT